MPKVKIDKWDAELSIPIPAEQDLTGMKLDDEIEFTVKGKVIGLNLRSPDEWEKKKGIDKTGNLRVLANSVEIGDDETEFEIATRNFDDEDCCCD